VRRSGAEEIEINAGWFRIKEALGEEVRSAAMDSGEMLQVETIWRKSLTRKKAGRKSARLFLD
jgi:hypothetical protein